MGHFLLKTLITAFIVAGVAEFGKRWNLAAAILVSLPLTSILSLMWIYLDSNDVKPVAELSMSIFWMVIPSLAFFPILALLLRYGSFGLALTLACIGTALTYWAYVWIIGQFGIKF